ncbi:uncharacterized protein LOC143081836 [Mytilus galloprovincialis]|uniref:uncharacterized protein LOC143081836 n=1 Tax=Mytilus galloprovincialis TaxID=29158 RepID=UPI003F7B3CC9
MKVAVCLVVFMLLVAVGGNMAKEDMLEDNGLFHNLVKRQACWGRTCRRHSHCCRGYYCYRRRCRRD